MKHGDKRIGARWYFACGLALYLYFMLPATALFFYELHHLTGIDSIYWGYSIFKAAGYYFNAWPYQLAACIGVAITIITVPIMLRKLFKSRSHG